MIALLTFELVRLNSLYELKTFSTWREPSMTSTVPQGSAGGGGEGAAGGVGLADGGG
jgi:hypothetical protein